MTPIDQCDEAAANVARAYRTAGIPAFTIRTMPDGSGVSVIGPSLDPALVAKMLQAAADAWKARNLRLH